MRTDVPPHSLLAKRRATRPGVERGGAWSRRPPEVGRKIQRSVMIPNI